MVTAWQLSQWIGGSGGGLTTVMEAARAAAAVIVTTAAQDYQWSRNMTNAREVVQVCFVNFREVS
jgi:hypothetical protein